MITRPDTLELVTERLDELERRVSRLEHASPAATVENAAGAVVATVRTAEATEAPQFTGAVSASGKALLGVAGAYLLRAISASGDLPVGVVAPVAIGYAIAWLVLAERSASRPRFASILYAATSWLILAPMLWEMCLKFHDLSGSIAACVVATYVAITVVLTQRAEQRAAASVAYAGAALTALALSITTREMAAFTAVLLAMVLLGEIARIRGRAHGVSYLVVLAADADIWALLYTYRTPAASRPEYPALSVAVVLAAPVLLFGIHLAGIAIHTLGRRRVIGLLDAVQAMVAFSLTACAVTWLTPNVSRPVLGFLCLVLSGACYALILGPFRYTASKRNTRLLAVWGLALLLSSAFLLLSPSIAAVTLGALAASAMFVARRFPGTVLEANAVVLMLVSVSASGMLEYGWHCLIGQMPASPDAFVIAASALAIIAYALCAEVSGEDFWRQASHLLLAFVAALAACGLLIRLLAGVAGSAFSLSAFHVAVLRTIVLCTVALVLAFVGSRLQRIQLKRAAYALVVFVAAKLLFEDLRHGRLEFVAASICLVAITLILVPRIVSRTRHSNPA